MNPFIAMSSAMVTASAFLCSIKGNNKIKIPQLESQSYETLSLHKTNVDEIGIFHVRKRTTNCKRSSYIFDVYKRV